MRFLLPIIFLVLRHHGRGTSAMSDAAPKLLLPQIQPISSFAGSACRDDFREYLAELSNLKLWAAKMFDSNAKLPTGILYGAMYEFGNFDECLSVIKRRASEDGPEDEMQSTNETDQQRSVDAMVSRRGDIRGKYCLARIDINIDHLQNETPGTEADIWEKVHNASLDSAALPRNVLHWGFCVPHSCSAEDVQDYLAIALRPVASTLGIASEATDNGPSFSVAVVPEMCTTEAVSQDLSPGEIIMGIIIVAFVTTVILASILEFLELYGQQFDQKGKVLRTVRCFSCVTNIRRLVSEADTTEPFAFINGIKVMTMFLVIFGHRFIFNTASPLINSEFVEMLYHRPESLVLMGGTVVVDTFLIISGCLLVSLLLKELNNHSRLSVWIVFVHRWVRLTPLYMIVVAFYATIFPRIADGPLWKTNVGKESEYCAENWWTNLLYINTFVNPERMCMIQSWYMAVDMHLFLIGVPITFLLHRRPIIGKILLVTFTVAAAVVAFTVTYLQQLDPILLVYFKSLQNLREVPTFKYSYIQSYTRALPYFIGMIVGYLIYSAKRRNFTIPEKFRPFFLVLTFVACLAPIFGSTVFIDPDHEYNDVTAAIFNPVHRGLWALGMCIIIFAEATESSYPITKVLRWKTIVPMSRITYSAFLVHAGVQIYSVNTRRVLETASMYSLFSEVIADTFYTFILAFMFTVVFEAPLLRLEKLLLENVRTDERCLDTGPRSMENGQRREDRDQ